MWRTRSLILGFFAIIGIQARTNRDDTTPSVAERFLGYAVAPLVMRGAIEPGGDEMSFNGTEIDAQIRQLKPDFSWDDFQPAMPATAKAPRNVHGKRTWQKVLCHVQNLPSASRDSIEANYAFLYKIATPISAPGGRQCTQASCKAGAAVWFCNDNLSWHGEESLVIGDYVHHITGTKECEDAGNNEMVQGQVFDTEGWNVIVNGDSSCTSP
ncbi:Uu.00g108720.m01.CDS01 [Anthostomella pinea]|uniref:Uu.00g108720.m01.CDS01 n=1 Tax=Anthostomella pinea TaxID=933095 RepID=A0AAI8YG08_9PEZI|nr:Uu.00g108720.m01.CDS01 [Anthostomella pinea]